MIERLSIKNFRSIQDVNIDLSGINVLCGQNGQGKSSVLEAIKYVLAGRNEWTSRKGDGYRALIRRGAKKAVIKLETDVGTVVKELPGKLYIDGKENRSAVDEVFFRKGLPINSIKALEDFTALSTKEQIDLISESCGDKKEKSIEDYFTEVLAEDYKTNIDPKSMLLHLKGVLASGSIGYVSTSVVLDMTEENAREERRILNREIKDNQIKLKDLPSTIRLMPPEEVIKVKEKISLKRKERDQVLQQMALAEEYEKKSVRIKQLEKDIRELTVKRSGLENQDTSALKAEIENLADKIKQFDTELIKTAQEGKMLSSFLEKIESFSTTHQCPISPKIKCKTSIEDIQLVKKESSQQIVQKREIYKAKDIERGVLVKEYDQLKHTLEKATKDSNVAMLLNQQIKNYTDELMRLKREVSTLNFQGVEDLSSKENTLSAEIKKLEEELEKSREFEYAKKREAELQKEISDAEEAVKALNWIIKNMAVVKSKMNKGMKEFTNTLNDTLAALNMPIATLDSDGLIVGTTPFNLLSTSEKLRVSLASQHALCQLYRFPIFIADNIELLDRDNFSLLSSFIKNISGKYSTIILAGTGTPKDYEGLGDVFEVKSGKVSSGAATLKNIA